MNTEKMNRKAQKTTAAMYRGIQALLREKPLQKISVTELCDVAAIHRSTFYNYYDNLTELVSDIETEQAHRLIRMVEASNLDAEHNRYVIYECIKQCAAHPELVDWLFGPHSLGAGESILYDYCREKLFPIWQNLSSLTEEESESLLSYLFYGNKALLQKYAACETEEEKQALQRTHYRLISHTFDILHE